jgi:hypothetical protein
MDVSLQGRVAVPADLAIVARDARRHIVAAGHCDSGGASIEVPPRLDPGAE